MQGRAKGHFEKQNHPPFLTLSILLFSYTLDTEGEVIRRF